MRREMIIGFVVGIVAGGVVDLLLKTSGLGLIGGGILGGGVGYFLIPARYRTALSGGGDGYSDSGSGDLSWMSASDGASDCGDSGSDGGGCDGGGGDGGGGGGD